jgi:hypothetical protein
MNKLRGAVNRVRGMLRNVFRSKNRCEFSSYEEKVEAARRMRRVQIRLAELEAEAMAGKLPRKRNE